MTAGTDLRVSEAARGAPARLASMSDEIGEWVTRNSFDLLMALAAGLIIALLLVALRRFGHKLIRDRGEFVSWRTVFGSALAKTGLFFIVMVSAKLVSGQAETPNSLQRAIDILFVIAAAFQAAVWGRELILGFIQHRIGDEDAHSTLGSAVGIIRLLVTVTLFAIAVILILDNVGVNVTGLVAGLGIGGIAIGLAAQGIFSDLFAALSIIFDRPFRRGDTITFEGTTGTVDLIGLKSTRVRALGGEEVIIANAKLLDMKIQNWARLERRRTVMQFGVIYQTSADLLAQIGRELPGIVDACPLATFNRAHIFQFGASSIDFELVFYTEAADYAAMMETRQGVMLAIIRRFEALGVDFAYPTQMGFLGGLDGKPIDPRDIPTQFQPAP